MANFKYLNQLDSILEWYNQGKSYAEIARLLGAEKPNINKEAGSIRRLLQSRLGNIHGHPTVVITEDIKKQIASLLNEGKTPLQISEILGIKAPTVSSYIRNLGLRFRPNPGNVHYFETIDSYAKAYILGFIAADGALVPAKNSSTITLTITVKYEDKAVLEFIKSEIGNTHSLIEITRPSSFDPDKNIHHIRLSFSTPEIVHDIMKYGIAPRKSLTMPNIIKNIPYEFRDAFIIGYFDGDGSVHIENGLKKMEHGIYPDHSLYINFRGTVEFLKGICEHLDINVSHIYIRDNIATLSFASKKDTYRLFQCYSNLPFYYERKYSRFLQRINHPSYDKYKQVQTISSSAV